MAGEDDQAWASADFARAIADRRAAHGRATTVLTHRDAGHRTTLPGESAAAGGVTMARGGTPKGDAALGRLAWQALRDAPPMRP